MSNHDRSTTEGLLAAWRAAGQPHQTEEDTTAAKLRRLKELDPETYALVLRALEGSV